MSWTAVAVIGVLAILLAGVRLVGLKPYVVMSGSMEPVYHVGSVIYVKPCTAEAVQVGDPITFVMNDDLTVATHRVTRIDEDGEHFYTKGDANQAEDGTPVYSKNLIGKPVYSIPKLGYLSDWITSSPGKYITISAAAAVIILMFFPDILRKAEEADRRDEEKKQASFRPPGEK